MKSSESFGPRDRAQFRRVAEEMPIAVVELDTELKVVYANQYTLNLLGLTQVDIEAGVHAEELVAPEQVGMIHEGLKQLATGAKPTSVSLRLLRQKQIQVLTETFAQRLMSGGKLTGFLVYGFDLSRRAVVQDKMRDQMDLFQMIIEHAYAGICVIDGEYHVEYANDRLCDITGRTRTEILGHDFRDFLHPSSVDIVSDRYRRRQNGESVPPVYDIKVLTKEGVVREVRLSSRTMTSRGGQVKTVAQAIDITSEKEKEKQLQESEHRYRTLVETMDSGFGVDDDSGTLVLVNAALCRMLGYESVDELVGRPFYEIVQGWSKENADEKRKARREGRFEHYEVELIHKSGGLIPAMISASPLFDSTGKYIGSFGIFTDVSELKSAEEEAHFLLDLLLHDIGNQLQLILAGADLLDTRHSTPEVQSARRYVTEGANRCIELITKVRRAEEAKSEPLVVVDLIDVIMPEITLLSKQYHLEPEVGPLPDKLLIQADSALNHLLWNLMENGVKHNQNDNRRLWITGERTGDTYELRIADNGPGLSDSMKRQLFDPKRRYGGVGLHLVHRLADKYGAWIEVRDRIEGSPDQGLEVRIRFLVAS